MNATTWATQILEVLAALAAAPLFLGWVNMCRAWLQNRRAPSLLLPYHGLRKLFNKDAVIAETASPLFRAAPYVVFGSMVAAAAIIPSMGTRLPFTLRGGRHRARGTARGGEGIPVPGRHGRRHGIRHHGSAP